MRYAVVVLLLCACLLTVSQASAAGIPIKDGGIALLSPLGTDADGNKADQRWAATFTLDLQITEEPADFADPFAGIGDFGQFLLDCMQYTVANTRLEGVLSAGDEERQVDVAGGLSLNLLADDVPAKAGFVWAPQTEWDAAYMLGVNLLSKFKPPTSPPEDGLVVTSLWGGPEVSPDGLGFSLQCSVAW